MKLMSEPIHLIYMYGWDFFILLFKFFMQVILSISIVPPITTFLERRKKDHKELMH